MGICCIWAQQSAICMVFVTCLKNGSHCYLAVFYLVNNTKTTACWQLFGFFLVGLVLVWGWFSFFGGVGLEFIWGWFQANCRLV
jgi:hypothetical protein